MSNDLKTRWDEQQELEHELFKKAGRCTGDGNSFDNLQAVYYALLERMPELEDRIAKDFTLLLIAQAEWLTFRRGPLPFEPHWELLQRQTRIPLPHETPTDDLHTLIELGYAAKDRAVREAAGRVDSWQSKLSFYLHTIRMMRETSETKPHA